MPVTRLLVEIDPPYMPPSDSHTDSPIYIRDHRNIIQIALQHNTRNGENHNSK
jgi:Tat protein secretion system quality control protein TatD with DNase activity